MRQVDKHDMQHQYILRCDLLAQTMSPVKKTTPNPSSSGEKLTAKRASFPPAASNSALQLKSNALNAVPTIIITSGSSSDTGPTEVKSISSDVIDAVNSIGKLAL